MEQKISPKICKRNMKLFPLYRAISFDYLFFYTINFLFLTQIKNISPSNVVLEDAFYSLFIIIFQIPAVLTIELIGRKKCMVLGNLSNVIYILLVLLSDSLLDLIIAEIFASIAFSLKDVSDLSLLNESIPQASTKSRIFAKLTSKGLSGYFILNSISLMISGFIYTINGYLPIIISLCIVIFSFLISLAFIDPIPENNDENYNNNKNEKQNIDENNNNNNIDKEIQISKKEKIKETLKISINDLIISFKYIISSKRLRSLILFSSIMYGVITVLASYQVSLLEEIGLPAGIIGIVVAFLEITASISSKKQEKFHNKFKNKSLSILGVTVSLACILLGLSGYLGNNIYIISIIAIFALSIKYIIVGIYQILIDRYYRNFTNEDIDSKIFSAKSFFNSISSTILGIVASLLLNITNTKNSLIIIGFIFLVLFIITINYMKTRLGLNPNEYDSKELKFDDLQLNK